MLIVRQSNLPKTQRKIGCLGYTRTCMYMYMHTLYVLYYTMLYFIGVHSSDVEVEAGQGHYLSDEHAQERLFRGTHTYTYMYMYMYMIINSCTYTHMYNISHLACQYYSPLVCSVKVVCSCKRNSNCPNGSMVNGIGNIFCHLQYVCTYMCYVIYSIFMYMYMQFYFSLLPHLILSGNASEPLAGI